MASIDDDDDFGFSAVSEDELKEMERALQDIVVEKDGTAASLQAKLDAVHKAILPLLTNLEKNPDKEYIYWPGRDKKIKAFRQKLQDIINS